MHDEGGGHPKNYSVQLRKAPILLSVKNGRTVLQVEMEKEKQSNA